MTEDRPQVIERRRHPRTQTQMAVQGIRLDPSAGDVVETFQMTDISRSGMGATSSRPFYPGQRLVVCLPLAQGQGQRNIYATITRCRPDNGTYHVGLEFDPISVGTWYGLSSTAAA